MVFIILDNINKNENSSKPGLNEELFIWSQSIFKYFIAQMEPLQLAFLHPIKALFYKDVCWPWGGLDPVSSLFMYIFWGEGWAQVRRIDYSSRTEKLFLIQGQDCCLCSSPIYHLQVMDVQGVFAGLQISLPPV